jgi:hypothetical protein
VESLNREFDKSKMASPSSSSTFAEGGGFPPEEAGWGGRFAAYWAFDALFQSKVKDSKGTLIQNS